eukprot:3202119-Prymnesium_polylepis.1
MRFTDMNAHRTPPARALLMWPHVCVRGQPKSGTTWLLHMLHAIVEVGCTAAIRCSFAKEGLRRHGIRMSMAGRASAVGTELPRRVAGRH